MPDLISSSSPSPSYLRKIPRTKYVPRTSKGSPNPAKSKNAAYEGKSIVDQSQEKRNLDQFPRKVPESWHDCMAGNLPPEKQSCLELDSEGPGSPIRIISMLRYCLARAFLGSPQISVSNTDVHEELLKFPDKAIRLGGTRLS